MLRSLLVLSVLVPGFFAALTNGYAGLLMYLWFALFRPQDWLWIDITSLRVSMVLGVVMVTRSLASGIFPNITHPLTLGIALMVCSSMITQTSAVRPDIGWIWIDFLFRLALSCTMVVALATNPKRLYGVLSVICLSLGFHASKAGLAFLLTGGGTRFDDGLSGAFVDNNGYALGTVMIIPMLLVSAQNIELLYTGSHLKWVRRGLYATVPLCILTVLGTYSRGGFLAFSAALLTFIMLQRRRFTALAGLLAFFTVLLAVVPIPQKYVDRLSTIRTYNQTNDEDPEGAKESAKSRTHFWQVGIVMATTKPLGVGIKQYEAAYDRFDFLHGRYGHKRAIHSSHLQVLAELGFFGAFLWLGLFAYGFVACLRVRVRSNNEKLSPQMRRFLLTTANGLMASMAGFIVGGAFLSLAYNELTWLTFGMIAALDVLSVRLSEQPETEPVKAVVSEVPLAFRAVPSYAVAKSVGRS
jgi:probable O-glycosylation ligase (exosortase A-associated)